MTRAVVVVFAALVACTEASPPPLTYHDAARVWSSAWCENVEGCFPGYVALHYGTNDGCIDTETADVCAAMTYAKCESDYPEERMPVLATWHDDLVTQTCGVGWAPASCGEAFR